MDYDLSQYNFSEVTLGEMLDICDGIYMCYECDADKAIAVFEFN